MTGAGNALKICGYLIANLIAFISVLNFLDVTISWFFNLVHHPEINFQFILGLLFYPFALIIGIPIRDCLLASKLIGIKVSLNEVRIKIYFFISIIYFLFDSSLRINNWVKFVFYVMIS
jgi:nucleoside permease NupC